MIYPFSFVLFFLSVITCVSTIILVVKHMVVLASISPALVALPLALVALVAVWFILLCFSAND